MTEFLLAARRRYVESNAAALAWMLDRPALRGGFLNTKFDPIRLVDYGAQDGLRGPDFLYGWIQGRGLEALVAHARFFRDIRPALAERLEAAARRLYEALHALVARDGHAYFCYGPDGEPVRPDAAGKAVAQNPAGAIYTYSDAFAARGLVAAAHHFALPALEAHRAYLGEVVTAIEEGRFQRDERRPLGAAALAAQGEDFGPRMILLGAAAMLRRAGLGGGFAGRFVAHVLERHYDPASGLLRDAPDGAVANPGHAIEFAGFALDALGQACGAPTRDVLVRILKASYADGRAGPGVVLSVAVDDGRALSDRCPWWVLPETIRAAALAYETTGAEELLDFWRDADEAFFTRFWRGEPPVAYQTMTENGPLDFVPATPDLDPGYHTGLSLLAAIEVIDRLLRS